MKYASLTMTTWYCLILVVLLTADPTQAAQCSDSHCDDCTATHIHCDHANIDYLPNGFDHDVISLTVTSGTIPSLDSSSFQGLSKLESLTLNNVGLNVIDPNALGNGVVPNLKHLDVSSNNLETLPLFTFTPNLESLLASSNKFSAIPDAVATRSLKEVDLSDNLIEAILPGDFSGMIKLESLLLNRNSINLILNSIFSDLIKLSVLELKSNLLPDVEMVKLAFNTGVTNEILVSIDLSSNANIDSLTDNDFKEWHRKLKYVNLDSCSIADISSNALSYDIVGWFGFGLSLANNMIPEWPMGINDDTNLMYFDYLDLSGNSDMILRRQSFQQTPALKKLYLSNVNLADKLDTGVLESINFDQMFVIDLSSNGFTTLSYVFSAISNAVLLEELYIKDNSITHDLAIDSFDNFENLKVLDLGGNSLSDLPAVMFRSMGELNILRLDRNRLTSLDAGHFDTCKLLEVLDLRHNKIRDINVLAFKDLSKLKTLLLDNNEIELLPNNVFAMLTIDNSYEATTNKGINIDDNFYKCNCQMIPFRDWLNLQPAHLTADAVRGQVHCHGVTNNPLLATYPVNNMNCVAPTIAAVARDMQLFADSADSFTCSVCDGTGVPRQCDPPDPWPQVEWILPSGVVVNDETSSENRIFLGTDNKLQLKRVYESDSGVYTCRWYNAGGEATAEVNAAVSATDNKGVIDVNVKAGSPNGNVLSLEPISAATGPFNVDYFPLNGNFNAERRIENVESLDNLPISLPPGVEYEICVHGTSEFLGDYEQSPCLRVSGATDPEYLTDVAISVDSQRDTEHIVTVSWPDELEGAVYIGDLRDYGSTRSSNSMFEISVPPNDGRFTYSTVIDPYADVTLCVYARVSGRNLRQPATFTQNSCKEFPAKFPTSINTTVINIPFDFDDNHVSFLPPNKDAVLWYNIEYKKLTNTDEEDNEVARKSVDNNPIADGVSFVVDDKERDYIVCVYAILNNNEVIDDTGNINHCKIFTPFIDEHCVKETPSSITQKEVEVSESGKGVAEIEFNRMSHDGDYLILYKPLVNTRYSMQRLTTDVSSGLLELDVGEYKVCVVENACLVGVDEDGDDLDNPCEFPHVVSMTKPLTTMQRVSAFLLNDGYLAYIVGGALALVGVISLALTCLMRQRTNKNTA